MKANNLQVMREALKKIYINAQYICDYRDEPAIVRHRANLIERAVNAALSKPSRNCDVGTPEEQAKRLSEWCSGRHCANCQFKGGCPDECKLRWAQMPYEANEKGEVDDSNG